MGGTEIFVFLDEPEKCIELWRVAKFALYALYMHLSIADRLVSKKTILIPFPKIPAVLISTILVNGSGNISP